MNPAVLQLLPWGNFVQKLPIEILESVLLALCSSNWGEWCVVVQVCKHWRTIYQRCATRIQFCGVASIPPLFGAVEVYRGLCEICLDGCTYLKDASMKQIPRSVKRLTITCGFNITDHGILNLVGMQELDALKVTYNDNVTGMHLHQFPSLRRLSLVGCGNVQLKHIRTLDPIKSLDLHLTGISPHERFYGLPANLEELSVGRCAWFEKFSSKKLEFPKTLRQIDAAWSSIEDEDVKRIANLPNLKRLDISGTAVTLEALHTLKASRGLTVLARNCWRLFPNACLVPLPEDALCEYKVGSEVFETWC